MQNNQGLDDLIYLFSKLPGLGNRSARRIVLHLLQDKNTRLQGLIEGLQTVYEKIKQCEICGNLDYSITCRICGDPARNDKTISIVETVAELWAIERSGVFCGKYHVLGGPSGAMERNPDSLKLPKLYERCFSNSTEELIIATNSTLEGQTTAYYITEYFKVLGIKTTRLASGIPIGGELDYLDEGTLSAALEKRTIFE